MNTTQVAVLLHQDCGPETAPVLQHYLQEAGLTPDNSRLVFGDLDNDAALGLEMLAQGYLPGEFEITPWDDLSLKPCKPKARQDGTVINSMAIAVRNNRMLARCQRVAVVYPAGVEYPALITAWRTLGPTNLIAVAVEYETEAM